MRVIESWPKESDSCRKFVESFTRKQKRELGKHPRKTLSDVNMATSQPVYSALVLSLDPESDVILFFFLSYLSPLGKKTVIADCRALAQTLVRVHTRQNSRQLS